jgi:hypothetical protein
MASAKPAKGKRSGRRGDPVSLHPLSPEQAISGMFKIKPADVKRIVASKPGRKKKG